MGNGSGIVNPVIKTVIRRPDRPICTVCDRLCNMEDIAEYIDAGREIELAVASLRIKRMAQENLREQYLQFCLSKRPVICICVVCANPSKDMDDRGIRLLAVTVIEGAYFNLVHGKGLNKEAAEHFTRSQNKLAISTRGEWHRAADISTPISDLEIERRLANWIQANP